MSQQINLYEDRLRPRHELATGRNLGLCTLVLLVSMTALAAWALLDAKQMTEAASASGKQLAAEQEKLTALSTLLAQRKVSPALAAELEAAKAMLSTRTEVMEVLDSGRLGTTSGFSGFMSGFARQAQSDLWLTGFVVAAGGSEIEIRGRLLDPSRLPGYVQRLSSEPIFRGRRFAALEMHGVDPEEPRPDSSLVAKVADSGVSGQAAFRLPRFVEFVLRSESSGGLEASVREGAKQ